MALDYSNRQHVNKNRPKKQKNPIFTGLVLCLLALVFVAGIGAGWFLGRVSAKKATAAAVAAAVAACREGQEETKGTAGAAPPATVAPGQKTEPALTFYDTLPKGGKAVLGTGINPVRSEAVSAPHPPQPASPAPAPPGPAAAPAPAVKPTPPPAAQATQQAAKPAPQPSTAPAPAKAAAPQPKTATPAKTDPARKPETAKAPNATAPADAKGAPPAKATYTVQVASHRDRKDAEAMRASLVGRGFEAYLVESRVQDKGTWYRVRIGRHLDQAKAQETAKRVGTGVIIPE